MSRVRRNGEYSIDIIDGGMLLYNNDDVMIFNETATAIWEKLINPIEFSVLVTELVQEYDSSHDEIEPLTIQLLQTLQKNGIVIIEEQ